MIRNLKVMGLVLGAFLTMSALGASTASAGKITINGGASLLTGTDTVGEKSVLQFTANETLNCHGHYEIGNPTSYAQTGLNKKPTEVLSGAETVTVTPTYTECEAFLNGTTIGPATVTMEECDYEISIGALAGGKAPISTSLECPDGKSIIVHVYSNAAHTFNICTFTFGPTNNQNRTGAFLQNGTGTITLGGTTTGITGTRTGILCGSHLHTSTATLTAHVIIESTTGLSISVS